MVASQKEGDPNTDPKILKSLLDGPPKWYP